MTTITELVLDQTPSLIFKSQKEYAGMPPTASSVIKYVKASDRCDHRCVKFSHALQQADQINDPAPIQIS